MIAVLAATFGIARTNGVWSFRDPAERPFWSFGVDCTGIGEAKANPKNPGYRGLDHYPDERGWTLGTQRDLRRWGFNTLGGWSDTNLFNRYGGKERLPYTVVLHLGAYDQAPWHDMYAPAFLKAVDGAARDQIPKVRDDAKLIGYFTDNELGWWGDTLFMSYFAMPAEAPGKRAIVNLLREQYGGDFARFRAEWTTTATDFDGLLAEKAIHLRPGTRGIGAVRAWMYKIGRHYYSVVRDAVRRYDARHLILGDRYCQYYDPDVAASSQGLVDVASTNLGAEWNDGTTSKFFLDTLHYLTRRPVVISEFYMAAMENRSGNRNSSGGFPVVPTQRDRAAAFRRYVEGLRRLPFVVGAHWFQFYDEPTNGRGDGENYNMGLVDIADRPYEELVAEARRPFPPRVARGYLPGATERVVRPSWLDLGAAGAFRSIPPAPPDPQKGLKAWPRERGFVPPVQNAPMADLYATWERGALCLGLFAMDFADGKLYAGGKIPEIDRSSLRVEIQGRKSLMIRFGDGRPATCSDPTVTVTEVPGVKHTVIVRVPMLGLGKGSPIRVNASHATHGRGTRTSWHLARRAAL